MPYLNLDPNFHEHPKTMRLKARIGEMADAYPIRLWAYCAKIHPVDGALNGYIESEIEAIIKWTGEPGKAVKSLLEVGYLDQTQDGFQCHDWNEHQGHLEAFKKRGKAAAESRWSKYATSNATSIPQALLKHTSSNATSNSKSELSNAPAVPTIPTIPTTHTNQDGGDGFVKVWEAYPKQSAYGPALQAWMQLNPDQELQATMIEAIADQKESEQWARENGRFIPDLGNWLKNKRWLDVIKAPKEYTVGDKPYKFNFCPKCKKDEVHPDCDNLCPTCFNSLANERL